MQETINFTDDIDWSIINYTVKYRNSFGRDCHSATFPVSYCTNGDCKHELELSSTMCLPSAYINLTIYATNLLGDGPNSDPLTICTYIFTEVKIIGSVWFLIYTDTMNRSFYVDFNATDIYCNVRNSPSFSSCIVFYDFGENCTFDHRNLNLTMSSKFSNRAQLLPNIEVCFEAVAVNFKTTSTVILKGSFNTGME